jgi:hypothetical protein
MYKMDVRFRPPKLLIYWLMYCNLWMCNCLSELFMEPCVAIYDWTVIFSKLFYCVLTVFLIPFCNECFSPGILEVSGC